MAASVRINLNRAAMNQLLKSPGGEVGKDLKRRGRAVEQRARDLCPKRTRALVNSIYVDGPRIAGGELEMTIGADAGHALFVEKGTRKMAAQPFLEPALAAFSR